MIQRPIDTNLKNKRAVIHRRKDHTMQIELIEPLRLSVRTRQKKG